MTNESTALNTDDWLASVCAGSDMGRLVLAHDWASTPLGPPHTWSIGLRTAVGVCMTSRFPMLVTWGPDLIKIYNDGYRPILGSAKHPQALGARAIDVWPEIWDVIGPMFATVMTTGRPTWAEHQLLVIARHGFAEECYFIWSYSPLFDDDGSIGGVLDVVTETTQEVIAQRRLACLTRLGAALVDTVQVTDVCVRAATALAEGAFDIFAADLYLEVGDHFVRIASNRRDEVAPIGTEALAAVNRDGEPITVGGDRSGGAPADHYLVPIGGTQGGVRALLVASLNPQRPFDDEYATFVHLVASTIGSALDSAYRRTVELGEYRRISDTLQTAMLTPASDLPTVAARYLPAVGNLAVGGDWYDVIELGDGRRALVVGDCVGHGLGAATVMGQLRSATRAMLLEGRDPAGVLEGLDVFATSIEGADCTTVVVAIFDRHEHVVTYSRAGHPPPLVISGSGTVWLDGGGGTPLAVDASRQRRNVSHRLSGDDVIIMYSDGLVERRGEILDLGLDRLAAAANELYGSSVQQIADGLLRILLPEAARDDVVLVVKLLPAGDDPLA